MTDTSSSAPASPSAAASPGVLLLHGWQNRRPADHWQHWLADELTSLGHVVRYPQLPDPDEPSLAAWQEVVRAELAALAGGPTTVICHSLSCLAWLQLRAGDDPPQADRVALVSPPSPELIAGQEAVREFAGGGALDVGGRRLSLGAGGRPGSTLADDAVLVAGDDDPWLPLGLADTWEARVEAGRHVVPRGGHLTPDSGYGPWPGVRAWALGAGGEAFGPRGPAAAGADRA